MRTEFSGNRASERKTCVNMNGAFMFCREELQLTHELGVKTCVQKKFR